jgi:tetratricopeptide (TPR) repeat protein
MALENREDFKDGINLIKQGKFDSAQAHLEKYVQNYPDNCIGHWCLGQVHYQLKNYKEAFTSYTSAEQKLPIVAQEKLEKMDPQTADYRKEEENIRKKKALILSRKADCLAGMGRFTEAQLLLNQSLELDPGNLEALFDKGYACLHLNEQDEALKCFQEVIKLADGKKDLPFLEQAWCYKGFLEAFKDRPVEAAESYDQALKINQFSPGAWIGKRLAEKDVFFEQKRQTAARDVEKHLKDLYKELSDGLEHVKWMYIILFATGIALLAVSVYSILFFDEDKMATTFLSAGIGSALLVAFLWRSPMSLQKNRVDVSQWLIAYYHWINTHFAVHSVISDRNLKGNPMKWEEMKPYFDYLNTLTVNTIDKIETYCEFKDSDKNITGSENNSGGGRETGNPVNKDNPINPANPAQTTQEQKPDPHKTTS